MHETVRTSRRTNNNVRANAISYDNPLRHNCLRENEAAGTEVKIRRTTHTHIQPRADRQKYELAVCIVFQIVHSSALRGLCHPVPVTLRTGLLSLGPLLVCPQRKQHGCRVFLALKRISYLLFPPSTGDFTFGREAT